MNNKGKRAHWLVLHRADIWWVAVPVLVVVMFVLLPVMVTGRQGDNMPLFRIGRPNVLKDLGGFQRRT